MIVNGRRDAAVRETVAALAKSGEAHGIAADMATAAGAQTVLEGASRIGAVDILVNNVGFFEVRKFAEISDREWTDMFELNVMACASRAPFPACWARLGPHRVHRQRPEREPKSDMAHYAMSKAAQVSIAVKPRTDAKARAGHVGRAEAVAPTWSEGVESFLQKIAPGCGKTVDRCAPPTSRRPASSSSSALGDAGGNRLPDRVPLLRRASAINGAAQRWMGAPPSALSRKPAPSPFAREARRNSSSRTSEVEAAPVVDLAPWRGQAGRWDRCSRSSPRTRPLPARRSIPRKTSLVKPSMCAPSRRARVPRRTQVDQFTGALPEQLRASSRRRSIARKPEWLRAAELRLAGDPPRRWPPRKAPQLDRASLPSTCRSDGNWQHEKPHAAHAARRSDWDARSRR